MHLPVRVLACSFLLTPAFSRWPDAQQAPQQEEALEQQAPQQEQQEMDNEPPPMGDANFLLPLLDLGASAFSAVAPDTHATAFDIRQFMLL